MAILDNPKVKVCEAELKGCEEKSSLNRQGNDRKYFDRVREMKTIEFASKVAQRLNSPLPLVSNQL